MSPKLKHDLRYLYKRQGATVAQCNPDMGFFLGNLGCPAFTNLNFNPRGVKGVSDGFLALAGRVAFLCKLQWGRDLSVAEMQDGPIVRVAADGDIELQWGRDLSVAEMRCILWNG